jgi:hypothetical protein
MTAITIGSQVTIHETHRRGDRWKNGTQARVENFDGDRVIVSVKQEDLSKRVGYEVRIIGSAVLEDLRHA